MLGLILFLIAVLVVFGLGFAVKALFWVALVLFVIWANFLITAWSNAVNLTDGLDGLATGA